MKKFIYIALIACASLFAACNEYDHLDGKGSSDNVDLSNLAASPRIGSVVLKWDNPANPDYYYATVQYVNAAGDAVTTKVSVYSTDPDKGDGHTRAYITGFNDTNTYEFQVTPYTVYGVAGKTETVSCAPEDAKFAYKYVAETATAESAVEGGIVSWVNEYDVPIKIKVSYKNILGEDVEEIIESSKSGSISVGAFAVPTEVTIVTMEKGGSLSSEPTKITVTPAKGEIPRQNMSVVMNLDFVPDILGGGMGFDKLFDGNWKSTWHSNTNNRHPYEIVVDLSASYQVAMVEVVKRTDDPNATGYPEAIKFSYSNDLKSFTEIGTMDFDASYVFNHLYRFPSPIVARYIKMVIEYTGGWTHLAEFVAYSDADVKSRYADESAAELVPDPDDDDTYYEETEYWMPASQTNKVDVEVGENSEWSMTVTGGDPWVVLAKLKEQAPGTVMVFHYKASVGVNAEFFWCPKGYGVGGPVGGKETFFALAKTDNWKTFKQNFASAWTTYGFTGAPGDQVRFDVGDPASGSTFVFRLMHWREATADD